MTNGIDLKGARGGMILMRQAHGYDTPIGHRCSSILEMLDAGTAKPADIARQVSELSSLISKGEPA